MVYQRFVSSGGWKAHRSADVSSRKYMNITIIHASETLPQAFRQNRVFPNLSNYFPKNNLLIL